MRKRHPYSPTGQSVLFCSSSPSTSVILYGHISSIALTYLTYTHHITNDKSPIRGFKHPTKNREPLFFQNGMSQTPRRPPQGLDPSHSIFSPHIKPTGIRYKTTHLLHITSIGKTNPFLITLCHPTYYFHLSFSSSTS